MLRYNLAKFTNAVNFRSVKTIFVDKFGKSFTNNSGVINGIPVPWHSSAFLPIADDNISISLYLIILIISSFCLIY